MKDKQTRAGDHKPGADDNSAPSVLYEQPHPEIARIVLNRPDKANAQSYEMLYALNAAFDRAAADEAVKVIVLAANGKHFSSGHDLQDTSLEQLDSNAISTSRDFHSPGVQGRWAIEEEIYFGLCWRWRNLPKITIAEVQGKVIAGGLMLVWPCDLVVAADDATFSDPVVAFGANGVEYFGHPWELGPRKAKEMLFTGRAITAKVARDVGMVNRVVPAELLQAETMSLALEIADQPMMGLKTAKESVNQMQNEQGFYNALRSAMSLQQLAHAHNEIMHDSPVDPTGVSIIQKLARKAPLDQ